MGRSNEPLSVEKVAKALANNGGVVAYAAKSLRCTRRAVYAYIDRHPELADVRHEARETLLDNAEHNVITAVKGGDVRVSQWVLERLGRARGYSTRHELVGAEGGPLFACIERVITDPELNDEPGATQEHTHEA